MNLKSFVKPLIIFSIIAVVFTGFKKINSNYRGNINRKHSSLTDTPNTRPCFLIISDIHLNSKQKQASSDGDSGYDLWDSAKKQINTFLKQTGSSRPKFLIVLGDLPFHVDDNLDNITSVRNSFATAYEDVKKMAKAAGIPLIIVPGNNDSYDGDYNQLNPRHSVSLFYPGSEASFADHSFSDIGFYSVYPLGKHVKFRLIVLNTVIFSSPKNNNTFSYGVNKQSHAILEMSWLRKQLRDATDKKEMILIAMHIPPGNDGYPADTSSAKKFLWDTATKFEGRTVQNAFLDIIDSSRNNIIGLLGSHTHMDGIRLLTKDDSTISSLLISVPAIAPGHHNNPAIKLVTYNPEKKFELEDFTTRYMKYWDGNKPGNIKNFGDYYTFKNEFHCSSDTSMLANIMEILRTDRIKLNNYTDSIYSVKNGSSRSINNNASVTIYVTKQ